MATSYPRRIGDYLYDIIVSESVLPAKVDRFYAVVVNMVRLDAGQTVSVHAGLQGEHGATPDEAVSKVEAAVEG
jgi:hypothetical protein